MDLKNWSEVVGMRITFLSVLTQPGTAVLAGNYTFLTENKTEKDS